MTIAALIQSRMLQTLLQAMETGALALKPGETVEAAFTRWITPPQSAAAGAPGMAASLAAAMADPAAPQAGAATAGRPAPAAPSPAPSPGAPVPSASALPTLIAEARIGDARVNIALRADPARIALLQPGAVMTLSVDEPAGPGAPAQVRLVGVASPPPEPGASSPQRPGLETVAPPASARGATAADIRHGPGAQDHAPRSAASPAPLPEPLREALAARAAAGPQLAQALARQDGLAPLFANLEALARHAATPAALAVPTPRPVVDAALALLGLRLPARADFMSAGNLRQAVALSGAFHEAQLLRGEPVSAAQDLKSALLTLRAALTEAGAEADPAALARLRPGETLSGERGLPERGGGGRADAASSTPASDPRLPAPRRDGLPLPQGAAPATIDPLSETPAQILGKLAAQTDAALDRISLSQYASLPSPAEGLSLQPTQRWFVEVPLMLDGRTAVLPLEIEEDARGGREGGAAKGKEWRVRFALDVEPLGLIHALVTMNRRAVQVAVWAEREETSQLVRDFAPELRGALTLESFDSAEIDVVTGRPRERAPGAGQYLDRRS